MAWTFTAVRRTSEHGALAMGVGLAMRRRSSTTTPGGREARASSNTSFRGSRSGVTALRGRVGDVKLTTAESS